jgi:transcription elongation factor/antiterminator RfaH
MRDEIATDRSCWYVIHTHPLQEERTDNNLRAWGLETFNPKLRVKRFDQAGRPVHVTKPLFPLYIFARFNADRLLGKVNFTRGVRRVVSFGGWLAPIDEQVIDLMRSKVGEDGFIKIGEDLKAGDNVVVKDGPLEGFSGMFERKLKGSDRVRIMLTTIGYQGHMELEREQLKKVS